jgi:hypothetical protein
MAEALLFVETRPESPEKLNQYHEWHDDVHVAEMLTVDGFVSARRWAADNGESFITLYEIDTDVDTAKANLRAAFDSGRMTKPVAVDQTSPAVMRYLSLISEAGVSRR